MRPAPSPPSSFSWGPLSYLLWGAGAIALILGILTTTPSLLFLGLPLLLAPVGAALLGPVGPMSASFEGRVAGSGRKVDISGTLALDTAVDPNELEVEVRVPPGLAPRRPARLERAPGAIRISLAWEAPNPLVAPVPVPEVFWRDPAGLVEREVAVASEPLYVERYPPELIRIGAARLERTIALPGETRSRRIGTSGEFFGIRDAAPSEPLRRINWVASARAGRWLANEYLVERTGDVILLVDARPTVLGPSTDAELFSLSVAAACGIAESFLREKARVGLGVYGEFLHAVPLGGGRTQRVRLRRALLASRVGTIAGPAERCAVAARRFFPPGVSTILISTLADDDAGHLVPFLRRRGYPVTVLSPSPVPSEVSRAGTSESDLADRISRLVRRQRIARVWRDAPVLDWEDRWNLGGLVELLRRPERQRRLA